MHDGPFLKSNTIKNVFLFLVIVEVIFHLNLHVAFTSNCDIIFFKVVWVKFEVQNVIAFAVKHMLLNQSKNINTNFA